MIGVELLEGIVGQNCRPAAFRDHQYERIASPDCSCRWNQDLSGFHRRFVLLPFGLIDSVGERGVHDDYDVVEGVFAQKGTDCIIKLGE